MCTTAFMFQYVRTNILMLPWRLVKTLKFWDRQKICGPIPFHFSWHLVAKFQSFVVQWSLKVRISGFPWQPIGIFKFRFRGTDLWPAQIVRAKFRRDPSRNQGGEANHPSPVHKMSHKNWGLLYRYNYDKWLSKKVTSKLGHVFKGVSLNRIVTFINLWMGHAQVWSTTIYGSVLSVIVWSIRNQSV